MKITTFNPLIVTPDAESVVKLFEELGFECRHKQDTNHKGITSIRMTDAGGFHVDVANEPDTPTDLTLIRMNVDDFDGAYEMLISKGFVNPSDHIVETESSKSAMLRSPSGFAFDLCQHKK